MSADSRMRLSLPSRATASIARPICSVVVTIDDGSTRRSGRSSAAVSA